MGAFFLPVHFHLRCDRLISRLLLLYRMKEHSSEIITDEQFEKRAEKWPKDTPDTKEAYYIRQIFEGEEVFPTTVGSFHSWHIRPVPFDCSS